MQRELVERARRGDHDAFAALAGAAIARLDGAAWLILRDVEQAKRFPPGISVAAPTWSPDGRSIAFGEVADGSDRGRLAVINPDGTGYAPLETRPAAFGDGGGIRGRQTQPCDDCSTSSSRTDCTSASST